MTSCAPFPHFALLDDCSSAHEQNPSQYRSRLYTGWEKSLISKGPADLPELLHELQLAQEQDGLHALLLADYEWGNVVQNLVQSDQPGSGELRIELFRSMQKLSTAQVQQWLADQQKNQPSQEAGLLAWHSQISAAEFNTDIAQIHAAIERGETYQVNYTFAFHGKAYGSPLQIYSQLRQQQQAEFGALIHTPVQGWILSFSPELFIQVQGKTITARPMKGTARAGNTPQETQAAVDALRADTKNRAENVMIVDLLRNDLGQVAENGSVQVSELFCVQRNGPVLGMTSTVQARLRPEITLADVLLSSFPCGSITGAPKHQTMQIIQHLEKHQRGIYTGAIGWLDRQPTTDKNTNAHLWDCCLSVPIRTLFLQPGADGMHEMKFPVGAGMVWDSVASAEWQECALKGQFALANPPGFELFETMQLTPDGQIHNLAAHFQRLQNSAAKLGFACDVQALRTAVTDHADKLPHKPHRLRLALKVDGSHAITHGILEALPNPGNPVLLILSQCICTVPARLRQHKTTLRTEYDTAMHQAIDQGAFDCLFFNEAGHLTEGARSNVFVQLTENGPWYTPPVSDGLLPGTARQQILNTSTWHACERSISRAELQQAYAIMVCNALRGPLMARLLQS